MPINANDDNLLDLNTYLNNNPKKSDGTALKLLFMKDIINCLHRGTFLQQPGCPLGYVQRAL